MANPFDRFDEKQSANPFDQFDAPAQQERSWGDVAESAASEFLPSVGSMIGGIAESVMHPIDTASNLGNLVIGAGQRGMENIVNQFNPELVAFNRQINQPSESEQMASGVGQFYGDRYGSMRGFKDALATDPAGVMADAATLLTGGGAALTKAGMGNAGALAQRAASVVDPLAMTVKAAGKTAQLAGKGASSVLGVTTGVGSEPIRQAFKAGKEGGETAASFRGNMRGNIPMDDVLNSAKQNLQNMNAAKNAEYRANMDALKTDKSVLQFDNINKTLADTANQYTFHGKVISEQATKKIKEVSDIINDWQRSDPNTFHTPEGLDKLKQAIGDVYSGIDPMKEKAASAAVGKIYNSVKDEITKQAPTYAKTMKEYADASDQIREIERSLSLGQKASADTAMRKLQSLMRNNVSTNYGQRVKLATELEQQGGNQIMPALAGQAVNDLAPRGLARMPSLVQLLAAPVASPRVMGEGSYYLGRAAAGGNSLADLVNRSGVDPRIAANLLYQAQQPK